MKKIYINTHFYSLFSFNSNGIRRVKIKTRQTASGQSSEYTTFIKGKRQRTEREMDAGQMINITQCDLRRGVQLNSQTKTYFVSSFAEPTKSTQTTASAGKAKPITCARRRNVTSTITVKDTGERKQMFGFTARHLIITMQTVSSPDACNKNDSKMEMDGWYIDPNFISTANKICRTQLRQQ